MTYTIAVAGKGGVGKSTFAALAVRHLSEVTGEVVLAVDADPNSNLGEKLGTEPGRTLGSIREQLLARENEQPEGISKQEFIDYQVRLALKEGKGFDLLTMGRQEGQGCYCFVNNMLRTILDSLSTKYAYVVVDNEAGMEHLSRRTTRTPDLLLIICDKSKASIEAAKRISSLATEMKIQAARKILVVNLQDPAGEGKPLKDIPGFDSVYGVRKSGRIASRSEETESLTDLPKSDPAFADVARIVDSERKRM
jgi:CO dehydrogenase maturation factor